MHLQAVSPSYASSTIPADQPRAPNFAAAASPGPTSCRPGRLYYRLPDCVAKQVSDIAREAPGWGTPESSSLLRPCNPHQQVVPSSAPSTAGDLHSSRRKSSPDSVCCRRRTTSVRHDIRIPRRRQKYNSRADTHSPAVGCTDRPAPAPRCSRPHVSRLSRRWRVQAVQAHARTGRFTWAGPTRPSLQPSLPRFARARAARFDCA